MNDLYGSNDSRTGGIVIGDPDGEAWSKWSPFCRLRCLDLLGEKIASSPDRAAFQARIMMPGCASRGSAFEIDVVGYDACYWTDLDTFKIGIGELLIGAVQRVEIAGYTDCLRICIEEPAVRSKEWFNVLGELRTAGSRSSDWSAYSRLRLRQPDYHHLFEIRFAFPVTRDTLSETIRDIELLQALRDVR